MLRAAIVDDEPMNRSLLEEMIAQFLPNLQVVASAESVKEAVTLIEEHQPDLVFLDVEMPENDGFDLLKHFKQPAFHVIFTTSHPHYAIKALKSDALDYLLKPIQIEELKESVYRAGAKIKERNILSRIDDSISLMKESKREGQFDNDRIALPSNEGLVFYKIDEITRCEADRSYCNFHLVNGEKILVSRPLRDFQDVLEDRKFFRVHKSNMVNLKYVEKYIKGRGGYVVMTDGSQIEVSARRKNELLKYFMTIA